MAKFPFMKQHDSMQCGAACLFMICRYYGLRISFGEVNALCVPTKEGMSMLGLKESAQSLGFECSAFKAPLAILAQLQQPCLLHWNQKHFVVLYGLDKKGKKFKVADPGKVSLLYINECPHSGHRIPLLWASSAHTKGHLCPMKGALQNVG